MLCTADAGAVLFSQAGNGFCIAVPTAGQLDDNSKGYGEHISHGRLIQKPRQPLSHIVALLFCRSLILCHWQLLFDKPPEVDGVGSGGEDI